MWNICRTCMSKEVEMISIFDQDQSPSIGAMIMAIASLEFLQNDKLPTEICSTCFATLEMTYYFKEQVICCNDALQKQVQRTTLLGRCKQLARPQTVNKEIAEKREEEKNIEYVPIDDSDENGADHRSECYDPLKTDYDSYDLSSKCDVMSLKVELPPSSVGPDDFPEESSSDCIGDSNFYFEGKDCKSEIVEVEEHGVQFGDNCEITPREIKSNNVEGDHGFCSDDDVPLSSLQESTGSYSTSQNVQQNSNGNGEVTSEAPEGLKRLRKPNLSSETSFQCTYCNKQFNRKSSWRSHIYEHTKPCKCEICGKIFRAPSPLKVHMRKHTGEKPFKCQYCNAAFKEIATLKRHTHLHTGESTPKPHMCEVCGKKFSTAYRLKVHMRTHTDEKPYACKQCNSKYRTNASLIYHMRSHGVDTPKPHKCEVCGYSFDAPNCLKRHMRKHTGEVPYKPHHCGVCGKSFQAPILLRRHMKTHTDKVK